MSIMVFISDFFFPENWASRIGASSAGYLVHSVINLEGWIILAFLNICLN